MEVLLGPRMDPTAGPLRRFHTPTRHQILQLRSHAFIHRCPFSHPPLTEETGRRIPRRSRALEHPPPFGRCVDQDPERTAQGPGQVDTRGIRSRRPLDLRNLPMIRPRYSATWTSAPEAIWQTAILGSA
jgi:hypothetical protein